MSVELELHLKGENADETEAALRDLQEWLRREPIPKTRIYRKAGTPLPEEMGVLSEKVLLFLIEKSTPYVKSAFEQVIDVVHRWKKTRTPNVELEFLPQFKDDVDEEEIQKLKKWLKKNANASASFKSS